MYMKVFPHGRGNGSTPTRYLVRPDYPGRDAHPPEVLRGDAPCSGTRVPALPTVRHIRVCFIQFFDFRDIPFRKIQISKLFTIYKHSSNVINIIGIP